MPAERIPHSFLNGRGLIIGQEFSIRSCNAASTPPPLRIFSWIYPDRPACVPRATAYSHNETISVSSTMRLL
jgi:hypothetical protein